MRFLKDFRRKTKAGLVSFLAAAAVTPQPHVRPSLRDLGERLQKPAEITALFKQSLSNPALVTAKALAPLEKPNQKLTKEFQNLVHDSATFVRGEIEDETVLSHLISLLELSLLKVRAWEQQKPPKMDQIKEECGVWFQFAAELPYNEASLVGLRVTGVIRSLLIDELEQLEKSHGDQMAKNEIWLGWLSRLRTPWPLDRMILTESKRVLRPEVVPLAEKVVAKIQKNPYLSVEDALKQIPGGKPQEVQELKALWRDQDMEAMRTEINRLQTLRLRLAMRLYQKRRGKPAQTPQELVQSGLLAQVPIDYFTGKPMQLPQADKDPDAGKNP